MELWYTNQPPFTSYTSLTPCSSTRRDFPTYVTSHIPYAYNTTCIECSIMLRVMISYTRYQLLCGLVAIITKTSPPFPVHDVVMVPGLLTNFLHSCKIKSGSVLLTRLPSVCCLFRCTSGLHFVILYPHCTLRNEFCIPFSFHFGLLNK